MKDSLGNELNIGDTVAYISGMTGSNVYLAKGYVKSFTPKNIRVVSDILRIEGRYEGFLIKPTRLVKVAPFYETAEEADESWNAVNADENAKEGAPTGEISC